LNSPNEFIDYLERNGIPSDIRKYNYKVLYKYPLFKKYSRKSKSSIESEKKGKK